MPRIVDHSTGDPAGSAERQADAPAPAPVGVSGRPFLPQRLTGLARALPQPARADWLLVAVLLVLEIGSIVGDELQDQAEFTPLILVLVAAEVWPLLWRRRYPAGVLAIVALSAFLWAIFDPIGDGLLPLLVALYSVAVWEPNRRQAAVAAVAVVAVAVVFMLVQVALDDLEALALAVFTLILTGAWGLGWFVRIRRELAAERTAGREQSLRDEARAAAAAERVRSARELHDVVAHSVGVMTVQAGAARMIASNDPAATVDAIAAIEASGREAMQDLRRIVTLLRAEPDTATDSPLTPQPGLANVAEVVSRMEGAGVHVAVEVTGTVRDLPPR